MKKLFVFLCVSSLVLLSSPYLIAGGIDNRSNFSGEYVRTLTRNAATDSLDAIAYNPAGVMKMENGAYDNLSLHYVTKDYTNIVDGVSLEQDKGSIVPALFALYKQDKWAGFLSFTIPAGGGEVEYNNGNARTRIASTTLVNAFGGPSIYTSNNETLKAESFYYGFTLGGAYKINDVISVSLAGRYVDANKKLDASFQLLSGVAPTVSAVSGYEEYAEGWGLIFGLSIDSGPLYIAMKYETETDLDFKYSVRQDSITGLSVGLLAMQDQPILDGMKHERNLPALFSLGFAVTLTPRLKLDAGMIYYFNENADWGGDEQRVSDGTDMSFSLEYTFSDNWKGSMGYLKTTTGMNAKDALKEAPELDATSVGLGAVYQLNNNFKMDFGIGFVSYDRKSYIDISSGQSIEVALDKEVKMISAGAEYRF